MAERKISYQLLSQKADNGFMVSAPSWERLYIDAALSLTDMLVKLDQIQEVDKKKVDVSSESRELLMAKWLNQVLALIEKEKFVVRRVVFDQFDGKKIKASLWGETLDPLRHGSFSEVKNVNNKRVEFGDTNEGEAQFFVKIFLES